jgi:L-lysine exporter family protein LysE/ArgO
MTSNAQAFLAGLGMGASLIVAIGAQNAFVLTQAIRRDHALAVAALCSLLDALLIAAGVCGLGAWVAGNAVLKNVAALGGAVFLLCFGARSLANARKEQSLGTDEAPGAGLGPTLSTALAVSLLNPHVYLDTVVMLGAVSGSYPGAERYIFGAGATTASFLWFFGLSLAGGLLAPLFLRPAAWKIINILVCLTVWWIAFGLIRSFFSS